MARPKKQRKSGGKSAPRNRVKKSRLPPPSSYTAYINKSGKRVKKGTRNARPIQVKINRAAAKKSAARLTRVRGKFIKLSKSGPIKAARKAVATRKLKESGAEFYSETVTPLFHYHYRNYISEDLQPETLGFLIDREKLEGVTAFCITMDYLDDSGNNQTVGTGFYRLREENIPLALKRLEELSSKYEMAEVLRYFVKFTFERKAEK